MAKNQHRIEKSEFCLQEIELCKENPANKISSHLLLVGGSQLRTYSHVGQEIIRPNTPSPLGPTPSNGSGQISNPGPMAPHSPPPPYSHNRREIPRPNTPPPPGPTPCNNGPVPYSPPTGPMALHPPPPPNSYSGQHIGRPNAPPPPTPTPSPHHPPVNNPSCLTSITQYGCKQGNSPVSLPKYNLLDLNYLIH